LKKHDLLKISTDDGITIDLKQLDENADSSMRCKRQPASNVIDESDLHVEKQNLLKTSMDNGITIDVKSLDENDDFSMH
jgi:hypothetical protein